MKKVYLVLLLVSVCLLCSACDFKAYLPVEEESAKGSYEGVAYEICNGNVPEFDESDLAATSYEKYGELDALGRCTTCMACIGKDIMPTEPRGDISEVRPTAWQVCTYDFIEDGNLYNRCHLIGFQLTGENANEKNLITGTRFMNVKGMLPFENKIRIFVQDTGKHVMYRVTPVFEGTELLVRKIHLEAMSVEDHGKGLKFNVFVLNVQPGVMINYKNGDNWVDTLDKPELKKYVLNAASMKFHLPECKGVKDISFHNRKDITCTRGELLDKGYAQCGICCP